MSDSAKFKVVVQKPAGITWDLADSAYTIEREALEPIGAEIVEIDAATEEEFIAGARDADAVIARRRSVVEGGNGARARQARRTHPTRTRGHVTWKPSCG